MHRIDINASCAFRVSGFAALSAAVVLAFSSGLAASHEHDHTTFAFVTASAASAALFMIDTITNKAVAQIPKEGPLQTVVTADGKITYSVDTKNNVVKYVENNEIGPEHDSDRIRVEEGPYGLALSKDGTKLFVFSTSTEGNTISVIDTRENKVEEVDPAPAYHFGIKATPDGHLTAVD
jgi:hypothetical protein